MSRIASHASRIARRVRYRVAHWGQGGKGTDQILSCADPREGVTVLGELVSVVYLTAKGKDEKPVTYEHKFARPRPVLGFTKFGRHSLVIAGGGYEMRARGIVR